MALKNKKSFIGKLTEWNNGIEAWVNARGFSIICSFVVSWSIIVGYLLIG